MLGKTFGCKTRYFIYLAYRESIVMVGKYFCTSSSKTELTRDPKKWSFNFKFLCQNKSKFFFNCSNDFESSLEI